MGVRPQEGGGEGGGQILNRHNSMYFNLKWEYVYTLTELNRLMSCTQSFMTQSNFICQHKNVTCSHTLHVLTQHTKKNRSAIPKCYLLTYIARVNTAY